MKLAIASSIHGLHAATNLAPILSQVVPPFVANPLRKAAAWFLFFGKTEEGGSKS